MPERICLDRALSLRPEYLDDSPLGTPVSGQAEQRSKRHFRPLAELLRASGPAQALARGPQLIQDLVGAGLPADRIFPAPALVRPVALRLDRPGAAPVTLPVPAALVPELAAWLGAWQRGEGSPSAGPARALHATLSALNAFERVDEAPAPRGPVTFVGHATVLLSGPRTRLLVDPFLLPREPGFPDGYQPLTHGEVNADVVLITHSHRDHFHLDSLLRLGADTLIIVPAIARESLLAVDMAYRLRELGFRRVQVLGWHEELTVGDFRIVALPFHGEQPTTEEVLHPEIRNQGNCYLVEGGGRRYGFVADAGRDLLGDVRAVASAACAAHGPLDVLFGGYRSWSLYPVQYPFTSVAPYLYFVPPALRGARQQIMNDAHALLDTAERWQARFVVPYADGGAPWHWQLELGPRWDAGGNPHADPRPEAVVRAAAERSSAGPAAVASPTRALLMRPGDSLAFAPGCDGDARIVGNPGHRWPYAPVEAVEATTGDDFEPMGLSRKRVLLRLLAREELARRGVSVGAREVQEMSDELRRDNGLGDRQAMLGWLDRAGLTMSEYSEILADWKGVLWLEGALASDIERQVGRQRAFATMRTARAG
jgi:L-ascorbate metabolism protein UlaG (beta-lactamase superfamily)